MNCDNCIWWNRDVVIDESLPPSDWGACGRTHRLGALVDVPPLLYNGLPGAMRTRKDFGCVQFEGMGTYRCGEPITASCIQDEPWYSDHQAVATVMTSGPGDDGHFFERLPDGLERAKAACLDYFRRFPGPSWRQRPDEARLERWIQSMWLSEEQMQQIDRVREEEEGR